MRVDYIQQKSYQTNEMSEREWWIRYKTDASVIHHRRQNFRYKRPLSEESLLQSLKDRNFFRYVQCDFEFPQHLRR